MRRSVLYRATWLSVAHSSTSVPRAESLRFGLRHRSALLLLDLTFAVARGNRHEGVGHAPFTFEVDMYTWPTRRFAPPPPGV